MRAGSLCTGIGGLDLAAHAVYGCELAWYAEIEPAPTALLADLYPGIPNLGDLTTIDWRDVEPVDVLTAGYPCQPFSTAGRRQGADDARHLWPHIAAAVRVLRPRRVVLENVAGHLSLGFGDVLGDLAEAGFDAEWCVLRASDVGAPHRRARLFVVAANADDNGRDRWSASDEPRMGRGHRLPTVGVEGEREPARVVGPPADTAHFGHERAGSARGRGTGSADRCQFPGGRCVYDECHAARRCLAAPDSDGGRLQERTQLDGEPLTNPTDGRPRRGHPDGLGHVAWGRYEPAIRRWEHVLGRPAPSPTDDRGRLNPPFVEWMLGYPSGWVDGLTRTQALKALGNAVVPEQGAAAVALLEDAREVAA